MGVACTRPRLRAQRGIPGSRPDVLLRGSIAALLAILILNCKLLIVLVSSVAGVNLVSDLCRTSRTPSVVPIRCPNVTNPLRICYNRRNQRKPKNQDSNNTGCPTPQRIASYSLSSNRQRPLAGAGHAAIFNTFRRFRHQVFYVAPPFLIAYATMNWAIERYVWL